MKLKHKIYTCLLLMAAGISVWHLYLNYIRIYDQEGLPLWSLWIGVMACSISIVTLYKISKGRQTIPYLVVGIYFMSLSLMLVPTSRYNVIYGTDILAEYSIAKAAFSRGRLPLDLADVHKYGSCLSVTVLPLVFSEVTNLSTEIVFRFVYPILEAFIPVYLFIVVKSISNNVKAASLSAIIYAISYWYGFYLPTMVRQQIAHIFLLLALWSVFRKRSAKSSSVALLFSSGIIFAHYTVADFTAIIYVSFLIAPILLEVVVRTTTKFRAKFVKKFQAQIISKKFFICYVVMLLSWFLFLAYSLLVSQVTLGESIARTIVGLHKEELSITVEYVTASPRGPITTAWFDLQLIMIAVASLYVFFKFLGNIKMLTWVLGGFSILGLIAISLIIPVITRYVTPIRLLGFGYIFLATFLAFLLLRLNRVAKLKYITTIFLLVSPTMNMLLLENEGLLMYHPEDSITPSELVLLTPIHQHNYRFAEWISVYVPTDEVISGDTMGALITSFIAVRPNYAPVSYPTFWAHSKYLIIPQHYIEHGFWIGSGERGERLYMPSGNTTIPELLERISIIYDNGRLLLSKKN